MSVFNILPTYEMRGTSLQRNCTFVNTDSIAVHSKAGNVQYILKVKLNLSFNECLTIFCFGVLCPVDQVAVRSTKKSMSVMAIILSTSLLRRSVIVQTRSSGMASILVCIYNSCII